MLEDRIICIICGLIFIGWLTFYLCFENLDKVLALLERLKKDSHE